MCKALPVLHHNFFDAVAVGAFERTTVVVGFVRLNKRQPHWLAALRAVGPVKRARRMCGLM